MDINLLITPVVAGIIGYITNALAIRMLFRPYESIYIGRFHVPFTPGIIPSQRKRIASSTGQVVSEEFLNSEILKNALLSDETVTDLKEALIANIESCRNDERSVREVLSEYYPEEKIDRKAEALSWKTSVLIRDKLLENDIGRRIAVAAMAENKEKTEKGFFSKTISKIFESAMSGIQDTIAKNINDFVREKGVDMIGEELCSVSGDFQSMKLCDIYALNEKRIPRFVEEAENAYREFIKENTGNMLSVVNVRGIIEDRIEKLSARDLEKLSFDLMKRELNAIVYLGALLGFLIGTVNVYLTSLIGG